MINKRKHYIKKNKLNNVLRKALCICSGSMPEAEQPCQTHKELESTIHIEAAHKFNNTCTRMNSTNIIYLYTFTVNAYIILTSIGTAMGGGLSGSVWRILYRWKKKFRKLDIGDIHPTWWIYHNNIISACPKMVIIFYLYVNRTFLPSLSSSEQLC